MVSLATRVMIWGRAGGRCSNPDCRRALIHEVDGAVDPSVVGEVCHIKAKNSDGARYDADYPEEFRESYENLLLMCRIDHKIIDDHPDVYTVERLRKTKAEHEAWVDSQLSAGEKESRTTKEQYSLLISAIETRLRLAQADRWLSNMGSEQYPQINLKFADTLFDFPTWAARQFWPHKIGKIEASVLNLVQAIDDYVHFFVQHSSRSVFPESYAIPKFYQIDEWDEERYDQLGKKWESVIAEARQRSLEIARALNLLIKIVRANIVPDYRAEEGWVIVPGVFADPNLSAALVPRYDSNQEAKILADNKCDSIFNVS